MDIKITAQKVIDRVREHCGSGWKVSSADIFTAGDPETPVTGIATSFTPSIDVLQRSVAAGKNLIITQQPAFYGEKEEYLANDPAFLFKKDYIAEHQLVLWRFYDNWNSRQVDGQLFGLARALGWDKYHLHTGDGEAYARANKYFLLPERPLKEKLVEIKKKLNIPGLRVIGDPKTPIRKAALSHGMFALSELQEFMKVPDLDLIVIAEAIEWESCEYFRDMLTWKGKNKAMVLIGRQASEDPGYGEAASWLNTFIHEVPVEWIPANEPFWIP